MNNKIKSIILKCVGKFKFEIIGSDFNNEDKVSCILKSGKYNYIFRFIGFNVSLNAIETYDESKSLKELAIYKRSKVVESIEEMELLVDSFLYEVENKNL